MVRAKRDKVAILLVLHDVLSRVECNAMGSTSATPGTMGSETEKAKRQENKSEAAAILRLNKAGRRYLVEDSPSRAKGVVV